VLGERSWAMSEQVRTISRERMNGRSGRADAETRAAVRGWLAHFLEL
jgi:mRNA interferase MazF